MKDSRDFDKLILCLHGSTAFQYLNAGCEFGLFRFLSQSPGATRETVRRNIEIPDHSLRCLLFGLSALKLIEYKEYGYYNARVISLMFQLNEWTLLESMIRFQARITYPGLAELPKSLACGSNLGLRHFPGTGGTIYHRLSYDPGLQEVFYSYMESYSAYAFPHLIRHLDISGGCSALDVGGGLGFNAIALARQFPGLSVKVMDLPASIALLDEKITRESLEQRVSCIAGDFFEIPFPSHQDYVFFIHQLVIWSPEQIDLLLKKAFQALNPGGEIVVFSSISEDSEDGPLMAALDSAYFCSLASGTGMIYPWKDYEAHLSEAGFINCIRHRCSTWTPHGIVLARKPL